VLPGATGGTASVFNFSSGAALSFTAAAGKDNAVLVVEGDTPGAVILIDTEDTVTPGNGCTAIDAKTVSCAALSGSSPPCG
jgi:hypothetical protein